MKSQTIRWWPGLVILLFGTAMLAFVRFQDQWPFQRRNLVSAQIIGGLVILLLIWWTFLSRVGKRLRLSVTFGFVALAILAATLFRIRGMSGDMLPIVEFRWLKSSLSSQATQTPLPVVAVTNAVVTPDFPQYLGPNRDGVLLGPSLATNWLAQPPHVVWRQKIGAGWSGFAIAGGVAFTQEQRENDDCVVAYELFSGKALWRHSDAARYQTVIAGEGPRATPTVVGNRVYACGGTGILNCLDAANGKLIWSKDLVADSGGQIPQWGYACSPLVVDGRVIVHGGEGDSRSLLAFASDNGKLLWTAGSHGPSYASPTFANLAGAPQILAFNDGSVSGHNLESGKTLWERPWGNGNVVCAAPVIVNSNRVLFSSGYGVGSRLYEITPRTPDQLEAQLVWKSIRMKSKFAHLFARDGSLFGLDDGIFACVNLINGSQRWKEGRYGHGQGLLVGDRYLLMAESGELILLQPSKEAPNEVARFRVFNSKTWNPMALSGDLLLVRNDQEAACLRLPVAPSE